MRFWFIKTLRFTGRLFSYIILAIFLVIIIEYLLCPVYFFPEPAPFQGKYLFNPYANIDSTLWRKSNFQVQSHAWWGITDGRKNSNEAIDSVYRSLFYDVIAISDYQKINRWGSDRPEYIPVYEHGIGVFKHHQVVLGAKKVLWTDYPIFQNIHHKQHVINLLNRTAEQVYIAHPKLRGAYSPDDMKYLVNYKGIEVLNYMRVSIEQWDAALSAGRLVTIMGNDDSHDVYNPDEVGHRCTYINSSSLHGDSILRALDQGKAYGADIYRPTGEPFDVKREKAKNIPILKKASLNGDTLFVEADQRASRIRFIGQGGKIRKEVENMNCAYYLVRDDDSYIRTEFHFPAGHILYLNPVIKYDGSDPWKELELKINWNKTWVIRTVGFATLIFIIINFFILRNRIYHKRS